jgi:hypothetical protein
MRRLFRHLLITFSLAGAGHVWASQNPDILVDSNLNFNWSGVFVTKVRNLLEEYGAPDPFKRQIDGPMMLLESRIGDYLKPDSRELVRDLGNVLGLNVLRAQTQVSLQGLDYEIKNFKTEVRAAEETSDGIVIQSGFSASEIEFGAKRIRFSLQVPTTNGTQGPVINIDIVNPRIRAREDNLINFHTRFKVQDQPTSYRLKFLQTSFDRMSRNLLAHPEWVDFTYDRIIIPEVSLHVGNRKLDFSPPRIERLLRQRHESIKGLLLAQVSAQLRDGAGEAAIKLAENLQIQKDYWIDHELIASHIKLNRITSSFDMNNLELRIPGDFCTTDSYQRLKNECVNNKTTKTSNSRLGMGQFNQSLMNVRRLMSREDATIVASISEDYLNKLLVTTYDAGLWKETLDEAGVDLGPSKVTMRLDKTGETGTLFLDVTYRPTRLERLALGAREVRFPMVMEVGLRVVNHHDEPVAIIRLRDVDLSDETLLRGRPEHNLVSTIGSVPRLRGQVLKKIRKQMGALKNKDIIELRYPEFRGFGLEKVEFLSDGLGRMNAIMKLQDFLEEGN